jgi:hypothetical protein
VLVQFHADEAVGELRAVDGDVELAHEIGKRAHVVFVAVGQEDGAELAGVFAKVGEVGDDQVHPEHFFLWEHQADVDSNHVVAELEQHHVAADLAETAEGDDSQGRLCHELLLIEQAALAHGPFDGGGSRFH